MKEQIVDCGEETQQTDVGCSRTKTKVQSINNVIVSIAETYTKFNQILNNSNKQKAL